MGTLKIRSRALLLAQLLVLIPWEPNRLQLRRQGVHGLQGVVGPYQLPQLQEVVVINVEDCTPPHGNARWKHLSLGNSCLGNFSPKNF